MARACRSLALLLLVAVFGLSPEARAQAMTVQGIVYRSTGANIPSHNASGVSLGFYNASVGGCNDSDGCDTLTNQVLAIRNGAFAVSLTPSPSTLDLMASQTTGWSLRIVGVLSDEVGAASGSYSIPLRSLPFANVSKRLEDSAAAGDSVIAALNASSGSLDASKISGALGSGVSLPAASISGSISGTQVTNGTLSPSALSSALGTSLGGTGLSSSPASGAILYGSGGSALNVLAPGTNSHVLTLSGGLPTWAPPTSSYTDTDTRGALSATAPLGYNSTSGAFSLGSASGVADGYLSKEDFLIFNNKVSPTLTSGQVLVGSSGNVATARSLSGDATLSNTGALTIANDAVTSAKIDDATIANIDISASAAIERSKVAIGSVGHVVVNDASTGALSSVAPGTVGNVLKSDGSKWVSGTATSNTAISGSAGGLRVVNNAAAPNDALDLSVDEIILKDVSGNAILASSIAVTVDATDTGLNGLDTGSVANNTWYYLFVISNGSVHGGILSTSSNGPTMPSGYTYRALVSAVRSDGSSNLRSYRQMGSKVSYTSKVGLVSAGNATTWTSVAISSALPPIARRISLHRVCSPPGDTGGWQTCSLSNDAVNELDAGQFYHNSLYLEMPQHHLDVDLGESSALYYKASTSVIQFNLYGTGFEMPSISGVGYGTGAGSGTVASVAGKTGAVTLTSSDILGLGDAATKNTGTATGTLAAGDDSRFHNALTLGTANGLGLSGQALSLSPATTSAAGAMSAADKTKLDGVADGATVYTNTDTRGALSATAPLGYNSTTGAFSLGSASGVADGFLSKEDFLIFNNKVGPALTSGQVLVGSSGNVATARSLSGDATLSNTGAVSIANDAVTSAKIDDATIANIDISASAAIDRSKVAIGSVGHVVVNDASTGALSSVAPGTVGNVLKSDGSKWVSGTASSPAISGSAGGLRVVNNAAAPNDALDLSVDEIILKDVSGNAILASSIAVTVDATDTGLNGLDTGSVANNTWYYLFVISNGSVHGGILSTSSNGPTMPSGYTYRALVSAVRANSSGDFLSFNQLGSKIQYRDTYGSAYQVVGSGAATSPTSVSLASVVPPDSRRITIDLGCYVVSTSNSGYCRVATSNSTTTQAAFAYARYWPSDYSADTKQADVLLVTSQTLYYYVDDADLTTNVYVTGFEMPSISSVGYGTGSSASVPSQINMTGQHKVVGRSSSGSGGGEEISYKDGLFNSNVYSTTETLIGEWLGAPLYRKVIDFGALPNTTSKTVAHGISGGSFSASSIVRIYGVAKDSGVASVTLPYVSGGPTGAIAMGADATIVLVATYLDWTAFESTYIIVEYTK